MGSATAQNLLVTDWIDVTQSDLLSIVSTPKVLLDAPWAGKILLIKQRVMNWDDGTTPYTYAWFMFIQMWGNTLFNLSNPLTGASVIKTAGGQAANLTENTQVVLTGSSTDPTAGDGTMKIKLFYTIEDL